MSPDAARGSPPGELLAEFLRLDPSQPATAFFRWFEVGGSLHEFDRRIALAFLWTDAEWASRLQGAGFDPVEITPCLERSVVRRRARTA